MSQDFQQFQDAYQSPNTVARKPSRGCCLLVFLGLGLGCVLLCCGGGAGLMYFGMNIMSAEIANQLQDNPVFREHIGEIETFEVNFAQSAATDDDVFVYDVQGNKGKGRVTARTTTDANGNEQIVWAKLRTADGQTIPLIGNEED
jgi:hypothetical protein